MKTHIYKTSIYGNLISTDYEMSRKELYKARQDALKKLRETFKWENYNEAWNHCLYYAELNGEAYIYPEGYLFTEDEFETLIQRREGMGYVGAWHRMPSIN